MSKKLQNNGRDIFISKGENLKSLGSESAVYCKRVKPRRVGLDSDLVKDKRRLAKGKRRREISYRKRELDFKCFKAVKRLHFRAEVDSLRKVIRHNEVDFIRFQGEKSLVADDEGFFFGRVHKIVPRVFFSLWKVLRI